MHSYCGNCDILSYDVASYMDFVFFLVCAVILYANLYIMI